MSGTDPEQYAVDRLNAAASGYAAWRALPKNRELWDYIGDLPYGQIDVFSHYILEELLFPPHEAELTAVAQEVEALLKAGDNDVAGLLIVGLFEGLQNNLIWSGLSLETFRSFLGPLGRKGWDDVIAFWETGTLIPGP